MNTFFILLDIVLFFVVVKYLIDIKHMSVKLTKEPELIRARNPKDKHYMMIKGLY